MQRFRSSFTILVASLLLAGSSVSANAAVRGSAQYQSSAIQSSPAAPPSPGYWTPERKREAQPIFAAAATSTLPAMTAKKWTGGGAPAANVGRVFFTTSEGDHSCSASVISAANRDTVVTAAHCVRPPGSSELARNWIFAPGYDGSSPYGEWPARSLHVSSSWYVDGSNDLNKDVGFAVLQPLAGRHIADAVGSNRIAFGTSRGGPTHLFGYPAKRPFSGDELYYCSGEARPDLNHPGSTGLQIDCDMNQGASGGPWFAEFSPATGGTVVSVSSTLERTIGGQTLNGPSFDASIKAVYDAAQVG